MLIFKEATLIASILYFTSLTAATNLSKSYQFPEKHLFYDYGSFEKSNFVYAVCDKPRLNDVSKACSVTYEKNTIPSEHKTQNSTCDIHLKVKRDNHRFQDLIRVIQFEEDKAIVLWWETPISFIRDRKVRGDAYIKTAVVHFPSCKYVENEIVMRGNEDLYDFNIPEKTRVATYGSFFGVIYESKTDCGEKSCLSTFDSENKKVTGPVASVPVSQSSASFFTPIEFKSSSISQYVYVDQKFTPAQVTVSSFKNDVFRPLKTYSNDPSLMVYGYSTANSLIGLCARQGEELVKCAQFDYDGKLKTEIITKIDQRTSKLAVHNIRDGGFLIFTYIGAQSDVTRYDASGKKTGSVQLDFKSCDDERRIPWAKFFENVDNKFCVAFTCFYTYDSERIKGQLDWSAKCFF